MKKRIAILLTILVFSCNDKKEIELAKANKTIVADVQEHSPIYLFFKIDGKDTIADVNRKNAIVSTNWIFNIDKRLPLKLVVPELIKLQAKKEISIHKNDAAKNYFSYANDIKKTMAFLPFTGVKFILGKPINNELYFGKNDLIKFNSVDVKKNDLQNILNNLVVEQQTEISISFNKNCSFNEYIKDKVLLFDLKLFKNGISISNREYIY
jgi:hypothetical protein